MIEIPGAVDVARMDPTHPDSSVAAHYGDPLREQRLLATAVGLVDRSHRSVIAVSGEDRLGLLHQVTTQHLLGLAPMTGTQALVLSSRGSIEEHLNLLDDGATTWIDCEPGRGGPLGRLLASAASGLRAGVQDRSADLAVLSLVGPLTPEAINALGVLETPAGPPPFRSPGPSSQYAVARLPVREHSFVRFVDGGADLIVPRATVTETLARAGAPPAGLWAYEALRVQARRPRLGFESDRQAVPAELGWTEAVHPDKDCPREQHIGDTARPDGCPSRHLVLLQVDGWGGDGGPARHAVVSDLAGVPVGYVGTGAQHYELGPIGLAMVRADVGVGARLWVGGVAALVDEC